MEWALLPDASQADERPVLEVLDEPGAGATRGSLSLRPSTGGLQPYAEAQPEPFAGAPEPRPRKPKDLRKLGEWLKMTRELEAQRKRSQKD